MSYGYYWVVKSLDGSYYAPVELKCGLTRYWTSIRKDARKFQCRQQVLAKVAGTTSKAVRIRYRIGTELPKLKQLCEWLSTINGLAYWFERFRERTDNSRCEAAYNTCTNLHYAVPQRGL